MVLPKFPDLWLFYCNMLQLIIISFIQFIFKEVNKDTSKTWTRTLDPDPETPGPWKSWTLKNLDPEKPRPRKTWTLKNLDPEKPGPRKTWTLCLELKVWVSSFLNIGGSRLEVFLNFLQNSLKNIKHIRDAVFNLKFQAKRSTILLKRDSGICASLRISQKL